MVNELPNINDNARFSTTETMKILDICYNTLRSKTESGLIKVDFRSDGKKIYTGRHIKEFFYSLLK